MTILDKDQAMPAPSATKTPMKVNGFRAAREGNSQLLPLFPYCGPGDIVPCSAALQSDGSGPSVGYFVHTNAVDEVVLSLGSAGRQRTGDVFVGPRSHGVGGDSPHAFFAVAIITQRQREEGQQPETVTFQCEQCAAVLLKYEFDAVDGTGVFANSPPVLPSIAGSFAAATQLNATDEVRLCKSCGHANRPFPLQFWGWGQHVRAAGITVMAREALVQAGSNG